MSELSVEEIARLNFDPYSGVFFDDVDDVEYCATIVVDFLLSELDKKERDTAKRCVEIADNTVEHHYECLHTLRETRIYGSESAEAIRKEFNLDGGE